MPLRERPISRRPATGEFLKSQSVTQLNFDRALDILAGTPPVLSAIVTNLPRSAQDERPAEGAWSPREVLAHLLHAETATMGPRVKRASEQDNLEPAAAPEPGRAE